MRSTNLVILWTALVLILASNVEAGHGERLIRRLMKTNRKLIDLEIWKHDNIAKFVGGGFNEHRFYCDPTTHWPGFKDNNKIAGRDFDHGEWAGNFGHDTVTQHENDTLNGDEDPTTHWPDFKDNNKIACCDFDHGDEDPKDYCLSHGHRYRPPPCNPSLGHDEPPK
ncbi:hypothetical protein TIFTF001_024254 [Ficus carica]|uniref:Uncharacterized protein n=1 Tax=Ficus carica TaxID=3494 RepID=A0AA88DKC1_FICCA|nr:hypothetical protein TIFTF001_024254 [Ficus carica]